MTDNQEIKIDVDMIPKHVADELAKATLEMVQRALADPVTMAQIKERTRLRKERDMKQKEKV